MTQTDSQEVEDARVPARLWSATASLVGVRVFGSLCTFASLALLARHLSGAAFGRFTFWIAVFLFLESLVDCGTSTAAIQRGSHDREALGQAIAAGRRVRLHQALLGFLVISCYALVAGEPGGLFVAIAALLPLTRTLELSAVWYHAEIRWRVPVLVRAAAAVLRLLLMLTLWKLQVDSFGPYLLAHVSAGAAGNIALHLAARSKLKSHPRAGSESTWQFFRAALPLALVGIGQQAYFYADNLIVRWKLGELELGHYNAAVRIFSFLVLVAGLSTNAALPWLARRARAGNLGPATRNLALPLFLIASVLLLGLAPFASDLLGFLFGSEFRAAGPSLLWLLGAAAIVYAGASLLTATIAAGHSRAALAIVLAGLAGNILGNLWLVPDFGIEGAAIATLATEFFVALSSLGVLVGIKPGPPASDCERPAT